MISRRGFVGGSVALLAAPLAAESQPTGKVWRIGYIAVTPVRSADTSVRSAEDALFGALRELGYTEGQNLITERRYSEGRAKRFPEFAAQMVGLRVDIIIAVTTPAALAAKTATKTIPIVIPAAIDPVGGGLVPSLARPGGNLTGGTIVWEELAGKRLALLKEAVPHLSCVIVLWNAANPANASAWKSTQAAAGTLGAG